MQANTGSHCQLQPRRNREAERLHHFGLEKRQQHRPKEAAESIIKAIRLSPREPEYFKNLGNCYKDCGETQKAIDCLRSAISIDGTYAEAHYDLGCTYHLARQWGAAVDAYRRAIELRPDYAQAYNNLAMALEAMGEYELVLSCLQKSLTYDANIPEAWNNLGNHYNRNKAYSPAQHCYERAVRINPHFVSALNNLGQLHLVSGDYEKAIEYFNNALQSNPQLIDTYINLGNAYQKMRLWRKAQAIYRQALQLQSNHPVVLLNSAVTAKELGSCDEAITLCQRVIANHPDNEKACAFLVNLRRYLCDWRNNDGLGKKLDQQTAQAIAQNKTPTETPFLNLIRHADPVLNFAVAKSWNAANNTIALKHYFPHTRSMNCNDGKLRVGYLSNNFRNHASADLICGILKYHDREKFEVYCYSYGINDGSHLRQRVQSICDHFVDLGRTTDFEAAGRIYQDRPDILVDLVGITENCRLGISAHRPAPLQIRYLGFAGSSGATFYDYLITDQITTPSEHADYYSEKFIFMPDSYHVNDFFSLYAEQKPENDVSENSINGKIVYCCFNAAYKIDSTVFSCWMEILKQVPESELWLLLDHPHAQQNLLKYAVSAGISSNRIVFFPKAFKPEHLRRLEGADLALDTMAVSGAATTADALWVGVPVVTIRGQHFASSMSSSILSAVGLKDLVCKNTAEYIEMAIELGHDRKRLAQLKQKIKSARKNASIYNPGKFCRFLELGFFHIYKRHLDGFPAAHVDVQKLITSNQWS